MNTIWVIVIILTNILAGIFFGISWWALHRSNPTAGIAYAFTEEAHRILKYADGILGIIHLLIAVVVSLYFMYTMISKKRM